MTAIDTLFKVINILPLPNNNILLDLVPSYHGEE